MNMSLDKLLPKLSSDGQDFEKLSKWYLENKPSYKKLFKQVWLYKDFPKNWGPDNGTDLIAMAHSGEYWAIQAKNYNSKYYIKKSDIDSFLSDSNRILISHRLLIATTNHIGVNPRRVIDYQEKPVHLELLCDLENSDLN
jgi:predicted helicase